VSRFRVFTARRYASAVYVMAPCPSVSVISRCSTKTAKRRITQRKIHDDLVNFYRAMLCIRGICYGPVSVRPSVTSRCSTKTAKRTITQTTPHDSPGTLVF